MGGEYIQDNIKDIRSSVLSPPPNAADIYAAHFLGSGGAKQLFREIKNDPNTIAAKVFPKQAALNEKLFYKMVINLDQELLKNYMKFSHRRWQ